MSASDDSNYDSSDASSDDAAAHDGADPADDGHEPAEDADEVALDEALEALAAGDVEECLGHLEDVDPERGERWTTTTHALVEVADFPGAEQALARARAGLGENDEDVLWAEGRLRLMQWRLSEARDAFGGLDPEVEGAPLLENLALLAELDGDLLEADALYLRAAALDPEHSPLPPRFSAAQFEAVVATAAGELPPEFRAALDEIPVVIDAMPTAAIVGGPGAGHPPDVLGLFVGAPIGERGQASPAELPATIFLFQRNLERAARTREELVDEIRTTLYHELAHALGFDEEGVDELGLA